jgi:molybdopterin molybdotransferase
LTRDDAESTREQLELALNSAEVLLTVGGVSVGDHDVVRQALSAAGASIEFWKVKIKPGKPLVYARAPGCTVLGLPGNPVSAQVTFCLFALPLLRAMQGDKRPLPPLHKAELAAPLRQRKGRMGFHRITVDRGRAYPLDNQNSGSVLSLSRADALARMPAECESLEIGDEVDILWLDQF